MTRRHPSISVPRSVLQLCHQKKSMMMTRLKALNPDEASGKAKELFNAVTAKFGLVPNMMRTMGNSPALLEGYLNFSNSLGGGKLGSKVGGLIALAVAQRNECNYCLSAHSYLGANVLKATEKEMNDARQGISSDSRIAAILTFAQQLVDKKGKVNDADVDRARQAGISEAEIAEIVGHVALNILTNYFNITAATSIDFPEVSPIEVSVI